MRTSGIKFDFAKYAGQRGFGLGSFRLKDGTKMMIMCDPKHYTYHFCREKDGLLSGGFSVKSDKNFVKSFEYLKQLREYIVDSREALDAFVKAVTIR